MPARPALTGVLASAAWLALACVTAHGQALDVPSHLSFDAALTYATSHNRAVEAARRGRAIREANIRAAAQRPNPELGGEATRDTPHQSLTFGLPIEIGSQRRRRIDVAREELSLADVDVQASLAAMRRQVRESFYGVLAADQQVQNAEAVRDIAVRLRDATQARFEAGAVPRLDVMQATLGVSRAEADLDLARSTRLAAQAALNAVLDLPPQQQITLAGSLDDHTNTPPFDTTLDAALSTNTELVGLDREIAVEGRRLELLRAQRTPVPVFSAGALFNAPGEFSVAPSASFSVGIPLFSRNQGEIAASLATAAQLRGARDAARRRVENAVWAAQQQVDTARRRVATFRRELLPVATELESLSEESYQAGRTSVLGVLDSQRNLRDISRDAVQALLDLHLALAELEELRGSPLP
ncbi:MAG: TolC family protein [Vicinamibacterales bacterium]